MKYLLLILAVFLFSCSKKEEKVCYYCTFGFGAGGGQEPPRTVCLNPWEKIEDQEFEDANGNQLSGNCVRQ